MLASSSSPRSRPYRAATDPIGEVDSIQPIHPEVERSKYDPNSARKQQSPFPRQRRDKPQKKPVDPEHQVDDYA